MKIVITTGEALNLQGLSDKYFSDTDNSEVYFVQGNISIKEKNKLQKQGVRVLDLLDLVRKYAVAAPPSFHDIVGREECSSNRKELARFYKDKSVLVTGGEGYIGSALIAALLELPIARLTAFGNGENALYSLITKYRDDSRFRYVLGDIRDEEKLRRSFLEESPQIVFHAAAHKHVPILEAFPEEAVKTNILGTRKLAQTAYECGVERFILISTDKAVNPSSALGASKRIAEKICLSMDVLSAKTRFACVRFGNVFGSTGSAVPTFLSQLAEDKALTLTDKNMMRYFMSVNEAADLVLHAGVSSEGNLFSFDMGTPVSMTKIIDRVFAYCGVDIKKHKIKIIGNRGGEKFSEELIHPFESLLPSTHEKLIVLRDESPLWNEKELSLMCAEFSDTASFGSREQVFALFDKYITRYAGVKK